MTHCEESFAARDGLEIFEQRWLPDDKPRATIVLVHGINEHSGRYTRFADDLCQHGYAIHAMDLRGHGRSGGRRIWIRRFDEFLGDVDLLLARAAAQQPDRPIFLFGHSMGGAIATLFCIERQEDRHSCLSPEDRHSCLSSSQSQPKLSGLILSAPAVVVGNKVFPLLRRLASLASRIWPRLRLPRMGYRFISHDPAIVDAFRNDPLVYHGRFPVRTGAEILEAANRIQQAAARLSLPLLILHGTGDLATDHHGSQYLHAHAGSTDKTLHLYPGFYHEVFSEPERDRPLADLLTWLNAHVSVGQASDA
jgi:acylglycerol lipase